MRAWHPTEDGARVDIIPIKKPGRLVDTIVRANGRRKTITALGAKPNERRVVLLLPRGCIEREFSAAPWLGLIIAAKAHGRIWIANTGIDRSITGSHSDQSSRNAAHGAVVA